MREKERDEKILSGAEKSLKWWEKKLWHQDSNRYPHTDTS